MPCHDNDNTCYSRHYSVEDERQICEARWLINQLANLCKSSSVKISDKLETLINIHNEVQLIHRREDRGYLVNQVRSAITEVDERVKEITKLGGSPDNKILARKKELRRALNQVKALTDDQLMADYWSTEEECVNKLLKDKS